jgi:phosphoglycolate phosphatase-like HAD superfamily hydrolase
MKGIVLILDFDGVITSLNIDWVTVREEVSKIVGFRVESLLEFWERYFNTELFYLTSKIVERYELKSVAKAKPYEDVKKALQSFNGSIYIASMQSEKALSMFLRKHGLKDYIKEALGREKFGSKLKQIQYIINKEKEAWEIILVDDSRRNVSHCQTLGIKCILFDRKTGDNLLRLIDNLKHN